MKFMYRESQTRARRPSQSLMDCMKTVALHKKLDTRKRPGKPHLASTDIASDFPETTVTLDRKVRLGEGRWIRGHGYKRVVARSDNEPAILALLRDAGTAILDEEIVEKASPEADYQQTGLAEASVRQVKGPSASSEKRF